jgi:hypothetical protein
LVTLWNLAAAILCFVGTTSLLAGSYAIAQLLLNIQLDLLNLTMIITIAAVGIRISLHYVGDFLLMYTHAEERGMYALQNSGVIVLKVGR